MVKKLLTGLITMLFALDISAGTYLWWLLAHKDLPVQREGPSAISPAVSTR